MDGLSFSWDARKARENERKHGGPFEEARAVFSDEGALIIDDPGHSDVEDRFIIIGFSSQARILTVCHCYIESDEIIRIISARPATRRESQQYVQGNMK